MKRYGTRIMMIMLVVIFTMTMGFTFVLYQFGRQIITEQVEDKLISDIQYKSEIINSEIKQSEIIVKTIKDYVVETFDYTRKDDAEYLEQYFVEFDLFFKQLSENNPKNPSIYFYFNPEVVHTDVDFWYFDENFDGNMIRQPFVGVEFFDGDRDRKPWFYGPVDSGETKWTEVFTGNVEYIENIEFIAYTGPAVINDEIIGVAGIDFYVNNMETGLFSYTADLSAYTILADENLNTLTHPTLNPGENILEVNNGSLQFLDEAVEEKDIGILHYKWIENQDKLLSYKQLSNGWYAIETLNKDVVYSGLNQFYHIFMVILVIILIISFFISTYFGRKIVEPINTFNEVIEAIGNGNFDQHLSAKWINRKDELGVLGRSIIRMENLLKNSYVDLTHSNDELEKLVKLRTKELEESNIELEESLDELNRQKRAMSQVNKNLEKTLTAMEETQNELIEAEKAVALGYLVKSVAQDLNSPIGNIITINSFVTDELETIQKDYNIKSEDFEAVYEANNQINDNINTALEVLEEFTAISEKETELHKQMFNVYTQLLVLLNSMDYLIDHNKISIVVHCDEAIEMYGDPSKFMQIFRHLIINSLNHGFENREFGHIDIHLVKLGNKMLVQYRDDGVGIQSDMLSQIFNPFFTTKYHTDYKGLGLTIVKNNVENVFKGTIEVRSNVNNGVNYNIELNLNE